MTGDFLQASLFGKRFMLKEQTCRGISERTTVLASHIWHVVHTGRLECRRPGMRAFREQYSERNKAQEFF